MFMDALLRMRVASQWHGCALVLRDFCAFGADSGGKLHFVITRLKTVITKIAGLLNLAPIG
jgi:hypothetical protein